MAQNKYDQVALQAYCPRCRAKPGVRCKWRGELLWHTHGERYLFATGSGSRSKLRAIRA